MKEWRKDEEEEEEEMKWKRREERRGGEREKERAIKASRPVIITLTYNTHTHLIDKYICICILSLFNAGHDLMLDRLESFILGGRKLTEYQYQHTSPLPPA